MSLLAHCAGPAKFFPMAEVVFAAQPQWYDKISALSDAQRAEIEKMADPQRNIRLRRGRGHFRRSPRALE